MYIWCDARQNRIDAQVCQKIEIKCKKRRKCQEVKDAKINGDPVDSGDAVQDNTEEGNEQLIRSSGPSENVGERDTPRRRSKQRALTKHPSSRSRRSNKQSVRSKTKSRSDKHSRNSFVCSSVGQPTGIPQDFRGDET